MPHLTYREMAAEYRARAILIRDLIFELSSMHEIDGCLDEAEPQMTYNADLDPKDWETVVREYYDYQLYDSGYDGLSSSFNIELPVELVETYTPEEIVQWLWEYFYQRELVKKERDIKNDLFQLMYLLKKGSPYRDDIKEIVEHIDTDKWDEFVNSYTKKLMR